MALSSKYRLSGQSHPQEIVEDLRRCLMTRQMLLTEQSHEVFNDVERATQPQQYLPRLNDAHVFWLGGMFERSATEEYLGWPAIKLIADQDGNYEALHLPFDSNVYIEYNPGTCVIALYLVEQMPEHMCDNGPEVLINAWFYFCEPDGFTRDDTNKNGQWVYIGYLVAGLPDPNAAKNATYSDKTLNHGFNVHVFGFKQADKNGREPITEHTLLATVGGTMLIHRKGEAIYCAPAPARTIAKPKGFQKPNPSVSILKVNTPRLLKIGVTAFKSSSGREVSPHDRRGTWCTSKLGNRYWRNACKVKGGAAAKVAKVVKLHQPLR